jgi:alpha-tubulin suppressor-like RCC1 family protein
MCVLCILRTHISREQYAPPFVSPDSFGCGEHGQLGHGNSVDQIRPQRIEALVNTRIRSATCGSIHTALLSEQGELYLFGFGENFYPSEEQNFFYVPVKIPFKDKKIKQVACGQSHIIALTEEGDVYTWGSGSYGQLGHGVKGSLK